MSKSTNIRKISFLLLIFMFVCGVYLAAGSVSSYAASTPTVKYKAHCQNYGWMGEKKNGQIAGTVGKSYRLEAIRISLAGKKNAIMYKAHVAQQGWQGWKYDGATAGTTGKALAIEAIQIKLTSAYAKKYDVYYSVHVRNKGWLGWAKNGATAGSTGMKIRVEAIKIKLVKKGSSFSTGGRASLTKPALTYAAHCQNDGWKSAVREGGTGGTTGKAKRLEALRIYFKNFDGNSGITYQAHVANVGWQGWKSSGVMAGTTGKGLAIEAMRIKMSGGMDAFFDVYYRMHVANYGWLGWAKNGANAGTTGGGLRAEAIQIVVVPKGYSYGGGTAYINLADAKKLYWPVRKNGVSIRTLSSHHGVNGHKGIDIANSAGASWYAAYSGTIYKVYTGCKTNGNGNHSICSPNHGKYSFNGKAVCNNGFGNGIVICCVKDGVTYYMQYAHMNSVAFTQADEGKAISKGTYLGTVGDRGYSFGTHAHFEIDQGKLFGPVVNNDPDQAGCVFQYTY